MEYRLLQFAPFPAVIQDAAAVYAHVLREYEIRGLKCKIVLIGDSSGGNLALALTRWIRDEGRLPMPHALLLLSVSTIPFVNSLPSLFFLSPHNSPPATSQAPCRRTPLSMSHYRMHQLTTLSIPLGRVPCSNAPTSDSHHSPNQTPRRRYA